MASRSNKEARYNNYDRTDKNANRIGGRRKVGEADPATRRKFLNQALSDTERVKRPSSAPKTPPSGMDAPSKPSDGRLKQRRDMLRKET